MRAVNRSADIGTAVPHTLWDDLLGILTGTFIASLGIFLLKSGHVVTGGTAGLALFIGYLSGLSFALLLPLVNLPFLALAAWKKGWPFTLRSILCVLLVSVFSTLHAQVFDDLRLPTVYSALAGNLVVGVGLIILFRHGSSLGGFNVVALLAQELRGWRAGYVQMALDATVVLAALSTVTLANVAVSAVGAILLNLSLATNHRPGRYIGY